MKNSLLIHAHNPFCQEFFFYSLFNLFIFTLRYVFMYVSEPEGVILAMCWNASLSNTCKNGFGLRDITVYDRVSRNA